MNSNSRFLDLRRRAGDILKTYKKSDSSDNVIYSLIEELHLSQVELEVQNEDLINAQLELQLSLNKFEDLYNLAPVAYFTLNKDCLVMDANQAGLDLLGLKKHMLIKRCFSRYISPEFQLSFSEYKQRALKDMANQSCELKLIRWAGPAFDAKLESKAIQKPLTEDNQLLICITDISIQKTLEQSMHLKQTKMASIDRARSINEQIYSIANHQNHSLTMIDNYIYGCIRRLESEKYDANEILLSLKKVAQQSRTLANITLQMKSFTAKSILRYEFSDINTIINETLSLMQYEIIEFPVSIHFEPNELSPSVKLDKLHIQHVIINLARNAFEAMRDANIAEPKLYIEARLKNNREVTIDILDNGPGLNQEFLSKLFDPHFTTKPYAMGLGLSVCRSIVEKHDGVLMAQINPTGGAYFQITLPCVV